MGQEPPRRWAEPVLVVEDDPDLRELIQYVLETEGVGVATAADGQAAVEYVERASPALILLDRELPILDGVAIAARLRAAHGDSVRIIAMTAASSAAEFAQEVGAVDYLQKPFDIDKLVAMVRRLVPVSRSGELPVGRARERSNTRDGVDSTNLETSTPIFTSGEHADRNLVAKGAAGRPGRRRQSRT